MINATFHNPNWFSAHIAPLARSGFGEVILVTDEKIGKLDNLVYKMPPVWLSNTISRAGAKAFWSILMACKYPTDIFIGYHIFPSAITALLCARTFRAPCVYQCTSGPLELEGGGWHAENQLMVAPETPSALVETLVHAVCREFDMNIVWGSKAKRYLRDAGCTNPIEIVTGSVELPEHNNDAEKDIDIIYLARIAEYKRPDIFVEVIRSVQKHLPTIHVAMVGDGEDRPMIEEMIERYGLADNLHMLGQRSDVMGLLAKSKVFVLTSRWEGVSISMIEAMMMGVIPVVSDVGDLSDFVQNGEIGCLISFADVESYSRVIVNLLSNEALQEKLSGNAKTFSRARAERGTVSQRWKGVLDSLFVSVTGS